MSSRSSKHYASLSSSASSYSDPALSTSTSSSSSSLSSRFAMDSHPVASVEVLRCLRCAREVEATSTDDVSESGMVRIAQNLYYCQRCAKVVGYK